METNQNPVQEQSVQYITPENTQAEQQPVPSPEQPTGQLAPKPEPQPEQPTEKLYNPAEAARIVQSLTEDYFNPEYILLFGKLVGGTHHSDAMAYDLLMVVRETPEYNWIQAKRILRYKVPYSRREITYINLYIMPLSYVESNKTPFLYFAHSEGELLYCSDYCLSTMAALQFFLLSLTDHKDAWERYLKLVRRAGLASYTELLETAGLKVPFEDGSIKGIAQQMTDWLEAHQV